MSGKDAVNRLLDNGISLTPGQIHYSPLRFDRSAAAVAFECNLNSKKPNSFKRVLCLPGSSRRGISLFCTALKRQFSAGDGLIPVEFAVPEKCGKNLRSYVKKLSSGMKESFVVHIVKDRLALVSLLAKEPETLCVLPVVDGSNRYQLRDLVVAGAELLVADQNTAAEILDETVLPALTCDPLPDAIAECMKARLQSNQKILPVAVPEIPVPGLWIQPATKLSSFSLSTDPPLVTICLMHFERPGLIEQALASILEQTYTALEVVLVDDGSFKPETRQKLNELEERFQDLGWRIIRQANLYLGAARNTAAIAAKGQYLYFLDDDNVLNPHALETLVKVAEKTGADVVTAFADEFSENRPPGSDASASRRIVQIGDDVAYGLFRNGFGDSNALVRRSAFMALGGNTEDYGVGLDDHEFFARAVLNGYQLTIVPEALYWARQMPTRLRNRHFNANAGHVRVLRAFLPHVPPKLHAILFLAIGQEQAFFEGSVFRDWLRGRIRQLANTRLGVWLRFIIFEPVMRWTRLRRGETE
ncbi:MAG: glycosyltransferase [Desulfotignum sp.]|nr:glycosyltransferase [Desulfotignum sp.]